MVEAIRHRQLAKPQIPKGDQEEEKKVARPQVVQSRRPEENKSAAAASAAAAVNTVATKTPKPAVACHNYDTECMVCFVTMVEPVTLPCGHTFCMQCLSEFFERKRECPMCRRVPPTTFKLKIDTVKQNQIKQVDAKVFAEEEKKLEIEKKTKVTMLELDMIYGNRHEEGKAVGNAANTHKWTMFVKFARNDINASKLIEKVRIELHETFRQPVREIKPNKDGKFEFVMNGWGTFNIPITIFFKKGVGMEQQGNQLWFEHMLSF